VAGVAAGKKMQRCNGKAGSLFKEMWVAELAAGLKDAKCGSRIGCLLKWRGSRTGCWFEGCKVWQQNWLFVEWCGSRTGCWFEGCKSVVAEMAAC
jgi:hypothetical protein